MVEEGLLVTQTVITLQVVMHLLRLFKIAEL